MKRHLSRLVSTYLILVVGFFGVLQPVQAAMIGSEQLLAGASSSERTRVAALLERSDVAARLEHYGVSVDAAKARVAAMSDAEVETLAATIDEAPAGGIIGAIVFVFIVLLVTDILGFTKVFPFTRSVR